MIDLSRVNVVVKECQLLISGLDGVALDDSDAVTSQSKGNARRERAQRSQELQLLAGRFELAAALVRVEYWFARGEHDPLSVGRED